MERRGDDGRRGCRADVALRADGEVEERRADKLRGRPERGDVHAHPDHAEQEQPGPVEQRLQVHLHPDARDQEVEEERAEARRAGALEPPQRREAHGDAHGRRREHHPDEWRREAQLRCPGGVVGKPRGRRLGEGVREGHRAERHADDDHQVGERGDARVPGLEGGHAGLNLVDRTRVGAAAPVDIAGPARQPEQHRHPEARHSHVHDRELAEGRRVHLEDLAHRDHVRAAADPAARKSSHAGPRLACHCLGVQHAHDEERDRRAAHHARSAREEDEQQPRPEAHHRGQVDRERQEHQGRRQQHVA